MNQGSPDDAKQSDFLHLAAVEAAGAGFSGLASTRQSSSPGMSGPAPGAGSAAVSPGREPAMMTLAHWVYLAVAAATLALLMAWIVRRIG